MNLLNAISRRKSCRKFKNEPLSQQKLKEIEQVITTFLRLYPDVPLQYRFTTKTKGLFNVFAPHYLIVSGSGDVREKEAAGFLFQQLMLWFDVHGIGAVWLGGSRASTKEFKKYDIIPIAFGLPAGELRRDRSEFKRKKLEEITNDVNNVAMEAVRLAPSGINFQPWYFEKADNEIKVYEQILKGPVAFFYNLTAIDLGIALAHYMLGSVACEVPFNFVRVSDDKSKKGYHLFGKIKL